MKTTAYPMFDLQGIKRQIVSSYHEDGLADILLGAWFLNLGLTILLDNLLGIRHFLLYGNGVLIGLTFLYVPLKNRLTFPRVGQVVFAEKEVQGKLWLLLLAGLAFLFLVFGISIGARSGSSPGTLFVYSLPLLMLGSIFGIFGYALVVRRWLIYLGIIAVAHPVGWFLIPVEWIRLAFIYCLAGGLPVVTGLYVLGRFLQTHPVVADLPIQEK